ncbi:MAG: replication-associated recombination protein A, partial [Acholeplasma sp.]
EARIPLSVIVVDMALSPKSNTAYSALDLALEDFQNGKAGPIPKHIDNKYLRTHPESYHYPHNDPGSLNSQTHLPDNLLNTTYYIPKDESAYEKALKDRLQLIDQIKGKKRKDTTHAKK